MKLTSALVAVLAAGVVMGVSGCESTSSDPVAVPTTKVTGTAAEPTRPGGGGQTTDESAPATTTVTPTRPTTPDTTIAPVTSAPYGSGHGLCFDLNSKLADDAIKSLAVPGSTGAWNNPAASNDPISAGCDGVLSWMTVESGNIHPYTHVLFFADGKYLGTATSEPYAYTHVAGKTANTVSVEYRWVQGDDALCCPSGGPSTVTFTLSGGKVQANGQFPPQN
ncbi:LppP/LprE family lipoprotein [Nocardia huaxiensis]|uniref:LppP/LprE family lipoprotein n=1 Tax=Nocardia huaxiensis TaxID=2755382 RepID=A0A7D6V925_9NOCA|nr:LppP/LprE family lipoprotein [Nocardia huaxiensis]QLY29754.1 LppP/LprE family lipoprotein [Nocardia huaxiensis]UFS96660.1 LppP/LprE family lipoprotein [Nocardia huaxiensis]